MSENNHTQRSHSQSCHISSLSLSLTHNLVTSHRSHSHLISHAFPVHDRISGHAIYYPLDERAPIGQKENIHDTAKCASRFVAVIAARLRTKEDLYELAEHATVWSHEHHPVTRVLMCVCVCVCVSE
jgi:hypothetical protein